MAIKINAPLSTNEGFISNIYCRITDYQISKLGQAVFRVEFFKSEADAAYKTATSAITVGKPLKVPQIGSSVFVQLMSETIGYKTVVKEVEGSATPIDAQEPTSLRVPDLSSVKNVDIFTFGYDKIKDVLSNIVGLDKIEDC